MTSHEEKKAVPIDFARLKHRDVILREVLQYCQDHATELKLTPFTIRGTNSRDRINIAHIAIIRNLIDWMTKYYGGQKTEDASNIYFINLMQFITDNGLDKERPKYGEFFKQIKKILDGEDKAPNSLDFPHIIANAAKRIHAIKLAKSLRTRAIAIPQISLPEIIVTKPGMSASSKWSLGLIITASILFTAACVFFPPLGLTAILGTLASYFSAIASAAAALFFGIGALLTDKKDWQDFCRDNNTLAKIALGLGIIFGVLATIACPFLLFKFGLLSSATTAVPLISGTVIGVETILTTGKGIVQYRGETIVSPEIPAPSPTSITNISAMSESSFPSASSFLSPSPSPHPTTHTREIPDGTTKSEEKQKEGEETVKPAKKGMARKVGDFFGELF